MPQHFMALSEMHWNSAPKSGDKKNLSVNPANKYEALIEAELDAQEGADFLMVKTCLGLFGCDSFTKRK